MASSFFADKDVNESLIAPFVGKLTEYIVSILPNKESILAQLQMVLLSLDVKTNGRGPEIDVNRLLLYIEWLMAIRVNDVIRNPLRVDLGNRRSIMVPAICRIYLDSLGVVTVSERGYRLVPKWHDDDEFKSLCAMSRRDFEDVADWLRFADSNGVKYINGLPRDPSGVSEIMHIQVIENYLSSHERYDPSFAPIAGFFIHDLTREFWYPHVMYMDIRDHVNVIKDIHEKIVAAGEVARN